MENLLQPQNLAFFLIFGVPGVIALYFRAQFLTGKPAASSEGIIAYITISMVYLALLFPLFGMSAFARAANWHWAFWFSLLFVGPALLGILLGLNIRKGWSKALIKFAGISTIHPIDSAWDWRFANCDECWIIVALKDGAKWAGYLGADSFMSSDRAERDIYIQHVYAMTDDGTPWRSLGTSVWIAHGEIQSMEFLPRGDDLNERQ